MVNSTWDESLGSNRSIDWAEDGPHEVYPLFIEMAELHRENSIKSEWREAARWVKYEEDIEKGGQRWSKPYVPTVPLKSFHDLRTVIQEKTVLMLDLNCESEERAARLIVDEWAKTSCILDSERAKVLQTLLRRHVHLYEASGKVSYLPEFMQKKKKHGDKERSDSTSSRKGSDFYRRASISSVVYRPEPQKDPNKKNIQFLRKIPAKAECANIMVGELNLLKTPIAAFLRLKNAAILGNMTEVPLPTRFVYVILTPPGGDHIKLGRAIGTLMSDPNFKEAAYKAEKKDDFLSAIDQFLSSTNILPPASWDASIRLEPPTHTGSEDGDSHDGGNEDDGLTRTGKFFGGFINDIKRKLPWYPSDVKDALSLQCLATWLFLYFACLTPMITFGGLMGVATHKSMGTMETMVSGCVCGIGFALFSGQPLIILGSTGPVLVFEKILVNFCESNNLNYLEFRLWVGIWIALTLLILVATDASAFVSYITRFTEDNFATLIACIFMVEAIKNVMLIGHSHHGHNSVPSLQNYTLADGNITSDMDNSTIESFNFDYEVYNEDVGLDEIGDIETDVNHTIFLMSLLLFIGTFFVSFILKEFRKSPFFPTWFRYIVSDFAVVLAIVSMSGLDMFFGIKTPKLEVPENFAPSSPNRGWIISPTGKNPFWSIFAAALPAVLATILIFMDQQITAVIVNRKDHKLKKGCGYHLDLFVLAILIVLCSCLGLPWFVAATVESLTNVGSLKMESESAAPGDKPQFLGVREQRVSNVLIFITVGISVLMTPILRHVPMPVLYGVFLYMGFSALLRMELFHRILLFFMPVKYQPEHKYLREVPLARVHLFTLIQILCLVLLWIIKSIKTTSILFPVMLVVMMVVRKLLDFVFTQNELLALDDPLPGSISKQEIHLESHAPTQDHTKTASSINGCKYKVVENTEPC